MDIEQFIGATCEWPRRTMRVGCVQCDWVGHTKTAVSESVIHAEPCPRCGLLGLHEFPVFGSWPSDYVRSPLPCELKR